MLKGPLTSEDHLTERMRKLFGSVPRCLQVAALPWRAGQNGVEIMLITSRDTARWVLPKGWPEPREPLCRAAAREANEEAGLRGTISPIEAGRYLYAKAMSSGRDVPCEVLVFPLLVSEIADKWKEQHQRERRWVAPDEAAHMVREDDLGQVIADFGAHPDRFAAVP
ncbi:NUDIX hydrolase [Mesorhizobium sp. SP-1A]|uniref:NUDIX hydrolase n=1 Tax=Mesorhizobium sp. SP-1A TaxID=3077840 RepID=UPI0028F7223E|nr:NUDIX hydrolase [Mesorhizobium sp. SP-1A]